MKLKKTLSAMLAALMLLSVLTVCIPAAETELPFTDVKKNWSYEPIKYVYENGLMNGTGDGTKFSPNMNLSRAMAVTVLYRNDGSPDAKFDDVFLDVPKGKYYSVATVWAYNNGIVNGTGTDEWGEPIFSPDNKITRQELATMFARYAKYKNVDTSSDLADVSTFPDNDKVAKWASDAVKWAVGTGLITGKADGGKTTLAPKDNATRAEFAAIIKRFNEADFDYVLAYAKPVYGKYTEPALSLVTNADLYVAPDGNDSNPGTFDAPLATFDCARLKVRELKKTAKAEIVVAFKEGEYGPLTIKFTEEDTGTAEIPIKYCAYGDGKVTFNNGISIPSGEFTPLDDVDKDLFDAKHMDNIKKVYLGDMIDDDVDIQSVYLFSEDGFCNFARYPNKGSADTFLSQFFEKTGDNAVRILVNKERVDKYHTYEGVQIVGHFIYEWTTANMNVTSYDKETGIFTLSGNNAYGISPDKADIKLYINNVSEELDVEGEFWIDRDTKTLYVYKPVGNYKLATHGTFVDMLHSDYVTFENLDFTATTSKAMHIYADNVTLKNCDISYVAGDIMIRFDNAGVSDCLVEGCNFTYLAGNGIRIDGNADKLIPDGNKFINNQFDNYSIVYSSGNGLHINNCMGTLVANNVFTNSPRAGLEVCFSVDCIFEYNVFDNVMTNSADGGALYFGGTRSGRGNIVRYNLFSNIKQGFGIYSIYLDDGVSGQILYSNLFHNSGDYSIMISGGRDNKLYDNMTIDTTGERKGFWTHDKYYNMWDTGGLDPDRWGEIANDYLAIRNSTDERKLEFYKTRFPEVFTMILTFEDYKNPDCMINPNNYYSKNYVIGTTHVILQSAIDNATLIDNKDGISLETNDYFVNPSIGDYSIKEGSGYADNHFDRIGRY